MVTLSTHRNLPGLTVIETVPFSQLSKKERDFVDSAFSPLGDPSKVFDRKIKLLAEILNCTEEEATHIFLHSL